MIYKLVCTTFLALISMAQLNSQYLFNPDLSFVKPGYKGNLYVNDTFKNVIPKERISFGTIFKWLLSKNPQRDEKKNEHYHLKVIKGQHPSESDDNYIYWLGHSSFLIKIGGIKIITDPILKGFFPKKRLTELPCNIDDLKSIDYILISHNHRDHCDVGSLKTLFKNNPAIQALVPLKMGELFHKNRKLRKMAIQEAGWYQQYKLPGNVEIIFLPAYHWCKRGLFDYNNCLWGSFLIKFQGKSIYFSGDTGLAPHFEEIQQTVGAPDICLLSIGAYKPPYIMKQSHLSPAESADAFNILKGKIFIPMHWGTFSLSDEPVGEPEKFIKQLSAEGKINGELKLLSIGEPYKIKF